MFFVWFACLNKVLSFKGIQHTHKIKLVNVEAYANKKAFSLKEKGINEGYWCEYARNMCFTSYTCSTPLTLLLGSLNQK